MDDNTRVFEEFDQAPLLFEPSLHYDIGAALVLAPHPDDETLGCGGMIALLRKKEVPVVVCFITNGAASHPNSQAFPAGKLAVLRRKEALNACETLGVTPENVHFFEQPDGALPEINREKQLKIVQKLVEIAQDRQIKTLFSPYKKDAHDDHRATWKLANEVWNQLENKPALVEYPIWLWKNGKPDDYPSSENYNFFRLDIAEVLEIKKDAIQAHESQVSDVITDDPTGFKLTEDLLAPFLKPVEYYFFAKRKQTQTLSQTYFDGLYTEQNDPWNFEQSNYEKQKYNRSIEVLQPRYKNALEVGCSIGVFTEMLATHCDKLLAVDISEIPLKKAQERCAHYNHITFEKRDVSSKFPVDFYDLITFAEVGYYFSRENLLYFFENCAKYLQTGGQLLLVHWTSYVAEYPLSGREVHQIFEEYNKKTALFIKKTIQVHQAYDLMLWEKI